MESTQKEPSMHVLMYFFLVVDISFILYLVRQQ